MLVKLISYTPNPEYVVAQSARLCYSKSSINDLAEKIKNEDIEAFVSKLFDMGHLSPFEHVSFTFGIEGVSRAFSHQLVRHRIASYSQQSQRYVKLNQFEYIIPPSIASNEKAKEIFIKAMEEDQKTYNALVEILFKTNYENLINKGIDEKKAKKLAEKMAIEDARYVFPNACETKLIVTKNARQLLHIFEKRCCNRAQWEIRAVANEMLRLVKEVAPNIFKNAGKPCLRGKCPEGELSCLEYRFAK